MTEFPDQDFRFYFGAASGSTRKVVRQLQEPDVMLSYATQNNAPIDCEHLFIDSGGYSLMIQEGQHEPPPEYLDYIERVDPPRYALQDYPCEPEIMDQYDRSVRDHIELTTEYHAEGLARARDRGISGDPVAVLQGWELEDYLTCIERFEDAGVLTDKLGIGSVCRRHAADDIADIILAVREQLPNRDLHAFGVKTDVLKNRKVRNALDSADSQAYNYAYDKTVPGPTWHQIAKEYLDFKERIGDAITQDEAENGQTQLSDLHANG